jgi:hypothetical protein
MNGGMPLTAAEEARQEHDTQGRALVTWESRISGDALEVGARYT